MSYHMCTRTCTKNLRRRLAAGDGLPSLKRYGHIPLAIALSYQFSELSDEWEWWSTAIIHLYLCFRNTLSVTYILLLYTLSHMDVYIETLI